MAFDFEIRTVDSTKDIKQLINFLVRQDLGYPRYEEWVQKVEYEIDIGYKIGIAAFSNGHIIGDLVYQPHKELHGVREIKNLRIDPNFKRRDLAHFMLRQAEVEDFNEYESIITDVREDREEAINFLRFCGYIPLFTAPYMILI